VSGPPFTRRQVLAAAGVAPLAITAAAGTAGIAGAGASVIADAAATGIATEGTAPPSSSPPVLDLGTPAAQFRAFLKLNVSLAAETVYYVYEGSLEAAVPGRGVVPLLASTSAVRREVEPRSDGYLVSIWEATVYHRPGETEPLDSFINPLNGRTVRPFHQREGRSQILWTETGPKLLRDGRAISLNRSGAPFSFAWQRAGGRIWVSRQSSGSYGRHSLDPVTWPLEYSGPELLYSEKTTNNGLERELADPAVTNAGSTYSLSQVMLWWPWLLMGQAAGFLIWDTQGAKLPSLATLPVGKRRLIEKIHPTIFGPAPPWEGQVSLWTEYPNQRRPEPL
jgi:hypothetical protein